MKKVYRDIREISSTTRTAVWFLRASDDPSLLAFKHLKSAQPNPYELARLRYEFSILEGIESNWVLKPLAVDTIHDRYGILMPAFGDGDLSSLMQAKGALDVGYALHIAMQLVSALSDIHKLDIIHRNINPHSLLLDRDSGEIRLIDFSLALRKQTGVQTAEKSLEGSLAYISPEQTGRMNRPLDHRSDFYSLGVTLFEMLTGRLPFEAKDMLGYIHAHIARQPPRPSQYRQDLPPILDQIVLRLLEKNAEDRYQSAFGLHFDLKLCFEAWQERQTIPAFELGINDRYEALNFSSTLFGRDQEREQLLSAYSRVERGDFLTVLVGGASGVGKTALVHEVERPITVKRGFFVSGKFDQFQRQLPLAAFLQALEKLVQQTLLRPEEEIETIRRLLVKKMDRLAYSLLRLLPSADALIEASADEREAETTGEASRQTLRSLISFLSAYAEVGRPVVIFLDDLQWADQASLELIRELFQTGKVGSLLLVLAYRHNEVSTAHPFGVLLDEIGSKPQCEHVRLEALTFPHTEHFIAHTLKCQTPEVTELARWVDAQAQGNPFYIIEILRDLHQKNFFHFEHRAGAWTFDLSQLRHQLTAESIVSFLIERLATLPENCLHYLQTAACIGHSFLLESVKSRLPNSDRAVVQALLPAIERQLIVCRSHEVNVLLEVESNGTEDVVFQFRHDRIQQAFYAMIPDEDKEQLHLALARTMSQSAHISPLQVAQHYSKAWSHVQDPLELQQMLEILAEAARLAKVSNAYENALNFASIARRVMPSSYWQKNFELAFEIEFTHFEANFLLARFDDSEQAALLLLQRVTDLEKQIRIRYFLCFQYAIQMKHEACIAVGLKALHLCGLHIPRHPTFAYVLRYYLKVRFMLKKRSDAELINAPEITDGIIRLQQKILFEVVAAATNSDQRWLNAACIFKATMFGLKQGNSPETAYAYMLFSIVQGIFFKERSKAKRIAEVSLAITDRLSLPYLRGRIYGCFGNFIYSWYYSHHNHIAILKRSLEASYEEGDLLWIAAVSLTIPLFSRHLTLEEQANMTRRYNEIVVGTGHEEFVAYGNASLGYMLALQGLTSDPHDFSHEGFDEKSRIAFLESIKGSITLANIQYNKIENALLLGDVHRALETYNTYRQHFRALIGTGNQFDFILVRTLLWNRKAEQQGLFARFRSAFFMLGALLEAKDWRPYNPEYFNYIYSFLLAEFYRLIGWRARAIEAYEDTIETARSGGSHRQLAIALQTAFEFHAKVSIKRLAHIYWDETIQHLKHWGAVTRIASLQQRYGEKFRQLAPSHREHDHHAAQALDVMTLTKTSQALIGEVRTEALLKRLMEVLLENVGATRAALILPHAQGTYRISVVADVHGGDAQLLDEGLEHSGKVATSIIRAVIRSRKEVLLDDVANQLERLDDKYFSENRVLALLCVPMIHQGQLRGIVYLENQLSKGVFTVDRIQMVKILASQASISIENAKLYEELEHRVVERTRDIRSILGSLQQGIFTISSPHLAIDPEYSQFLEAILDRGKLAGKTLAQTLLAGAQLGSDAIRGVEQAICACLGEPRIAYELNMDHLPHELERGERILEIDWHPIVDEQEIIQKVLVVVRDVTAIRGLQDQARTRDLEMARITEIAEVPPTRLETFIQEIHYYLEQASNLTKQQQSLEDQVRILSVYLHTMKGLSRSVRFSQLASCLHEEETHLLQLKSRPNFSSEMQEIVSRVSTCFDSYRNTLGKLRQLFHQSRTGEDPVTRWILLENELKSMAHQTAQQLGKANPSWSFQWPHHLAVSQQGFRLLRATMVHLIRNALDHGIEPMDERNRLQKPAAGHLSLKLEKQENAYLLSFRDDGRGLDLERVKARAQKSGLVSLNSELSPEEIAQLIFAPGFSTASSITEVSGRGIGLEAVRHDLEAVGGRIVIILEQQVDAKHRAFSFELSFPEEALIDLAETRHFPKAI